MVRVMSVFHFESQLTEKLENIDLVGACMISEDFLALAKTDHSIEIKTLNGQPEVTNDEVRTFSTVDDIEQIIYCKHGHFIACLESRMSNYEQTEVRYVRIYANWDQLRPSSEKDYISTALRARIAGKITPMHKCLEMIELPLSYNPTLIACCQSTGNLVVGYKNILQLFEFKCCTNENTKHQYIDFFEAPFQLELDFHVSKVQISENFISCCSKIYFCVFKIVDETGEVGNSESTNNFTSTDFHSKSISNINLDEDVDYQTICEKSEINGYEFDVKMRSTTNSNVLSNSTSSDEVRPSLVNDIIVLLKYTSQNYSMPVKYAVTNLLQLKLEPVEISGVMRENNDLFKCLFLKPLYLKHPVFKKDTSSNFFMRSKFNSNFYGISVLITTQQDGFLYQINDTANSSEIVGGQSKYFLNVYPFTSPVIDVCLGSSVLHCLTENGIESYTVRIGERLFQDLDETQSGPIVSKSSISLINLRPFFRIHYMIPSDSNLVLLANDTTTPTQYHELNQSNWTIYNLKYPHISRIYQDFKEFADKSLKKFPHVYLNLLEEIHLMIRTHLNIGHMEVDADAGSANTIRLTNLSFSESCETEIELMTESCLSLADFYILSSDAKEYQQAIPYYEMAKLDIVGIFQRFTNLDGWTQSPLGLIYTIKNYFKQLKCDSKKYDEIFSSTIEFNVDSEATDKKTMRFGDAIIEWFGIYAPKEIALFCLESAVFREYMDEKIYDFLSNFQDKSNEEMLCIILYLLKKDEVVAANAILSQISSKELFDLLVKHWNILFEFTKYSSNPSISKKGLANSIISFSDFTELCFLTQNTSNHALLADVLLFHMFETKSIKFEVILKLFMEYLASQLGHDSYLNGQNILKILLEKYLVKYYDIKNQVDVDLSLLSSSSANTTTTLSASSALSSENNGEKEKATSWNDQELFADVTSSKHALKIITRIYLSQLKLLSQRYYNNKRNSKQETKKSSLTKVQLIKLIDEMSNQLFVNHRQVSKYDKIANLLMNYNHQILFIDERFRYLDWLPPFEDNLMYILNERTDESKMYDYQTMDKDLLITLIKLQALLCSNELSSEIIKEILQFMQGNPNIVGSESILVCIYPVQQSIDLIIKNCPQCVLEFGRCRMMDDDWKILIKVLQKKIGEIEVNEQNLPNILFFHRLLKETLEFLATTKSFEQILKIFPEEKYLIKNETFSMCSTKSSNEFDDYLRMCIDKDRSDKIKQMILNTGLQLHEAIQNKV